MDSTDNESFVTALSQPESTLRAAEVHVERCARKALEAVSGLQEALAVKKALDARKLPEGTDTRITQATLSDSNASTQIEPRVFEEYIRPCVTTALEAISTANNTMATKKKLQANKKAQQAEMAQQPGNSQANPTLQATGASTGSDISRVTSETTEDRIAALLAAASGVNLNARLLIAYPRDSSHRLEGPSVVPLKQKLEGSDLFAIIQTEDVNFPLVLPHPLRGSAAELDEIHIAYDAQSDMCYIGRIKDNTSDSIHLTKLEPSIEHRPLALRGRQPLQMDPGVWRVSVSNFHLDFYLNIDILVLKRPFEVIIHKPSQEATDGLGKRQATSDLGGDGLAKRKKGFQGKVINPDNAVQTITATLLNLEEGSTAELSSRYQTKEHASSYTLRNNRIIHENSATLVFECEHSGFKEKLAAKVFRYTSTTIITVGEQLRIEKELLKRLKHKHIVKYMAADPRMYTLYTELLPSSLCNEKQSRSSPFSLMDTLGIIRNISSALDYLKGHNLVHYDIKPRNIAYEARRGAVLLDFGLSSTPSNHFWGTNGYLPPETFSKRPRGFAGDIWALGITTLYIRGHIELPEWPKHMGPIFSERSRQYEHEKLWSTSVFPELEQQKKEHEKRQEFKLYSLIGQMLCKDVKARVGAGELSEAAERLLGSGLSVTAFTKSDVQHTG